MSATGRACARSIRCTGEGGPGPAADLQDIPGVPVLFLGISLPADGWRAPNEQVELELPTAPPARPRTASVR